MKYSCFISLIKARPCHSLNIGFDLAISTKLDGPYCDKLYYSGLLVANNSKLAI